MLARGPDDVRRGAFWLVRKGFFFATAGGELPVVWGVMLIVQAMLGDGIWALWASDTPMLSSLRRRTLSTGAKVLMENLERAYALDIKIRIECEFS